MNFKRCSAKDCPANGTPFSELPMFKFPRDFERCRMWVRNSGNEKLLQKPSRKLNLRSYLCAHHFKEDQFFDKFRRRLRRSAVPTIFPTEPLSDEVMSKFPVLENKDSVTLNLAEEKPCNSILHSPRTICSSFPTPSSECGNHSETLNPVQPPRRIGIIEVAKKTNQTDDICDIVDYGPLTCSKNVTDCIPSVINIPSGAPTAGSNTMTCEHDSITYIEGPWSGLLEDTQPFSLRIFGDTNPEITARLLVEAKYLEHCASENIQEIVVHHVEINPDGRDIRDEQGVDESFQLALPCIKEAYNIQCSDFTSLDCDIISSGDNQSFPSPSSSEKQFVLQSKEQTSGALVRVINVP